MVCLTPAEISRWVLDHGQIEDPSHENADKGSAFRAEFYSPSTYYGVECLLDCLVHEVVGGGEVLLVLTDSNPSSRSQEFIHDTLRLGIGETRHEVDAPGYLISADELQRAVGLFTLMASFRWKCYLYCSREQLTLYNWEGSIFEVWTPSSEAYRHVLTILRNFQLREIPDSRET